MNMIGLSWIVISSSLLLVVLAGVAVYWQVLRRREAITALQICQSQLEQHMAASHQKDDALRELSAGLRAEKAHVEQLQRQVEFAQQEAGRLRTEYRDQSAQLVEVQSAASAARAQYGQLLQQHDELKQASIRLQQVHDVLQDRFAALTKEHATLSSTLDQKQQHFAEQQQLLKESRNQLKLEFEQLAGQIFEAKGQAFSQYSQQSLDALLKPFREQIEGFRTKVEDIHHKDVQQQAASTQELHHLKELNRQITQEAQDLTTALKGQKKAQGNWGELILENVLERSGLVNGKDFKREVSFTGEINRQRPDVIVYPPQGKHLIIDAKVSLNAYTRYINAEDDAERRMALAEHVAAVGQRIKELSDRSYFDLPGLNAPEMVFMFVPIESAFVEALKADETLFQKAIEQNVLVATPTTLADQPEHRAPAMAFRGSEQAHRRVSRACRQGLRQAAHLPW
ncbi:DNA recombination protein RmuC, partial [Pseudomonas aeruginosa]